LQIINLNFNDFLHTYLIYVCYLILKHSYYVSFIFHYSEIEFKCEMRIIKEGKFRI